jgi:hypothetical protein
MFAEGDNSAGQEKNRPSTKKQWSRSTSRLWESLAAQALAALANSAAEGRSRPMLDAYRRGPEA